MPQLPAPSTYLGHWIDWTQGSIYGATITLPGREGNLLQSFLAIFTTFVFTQVWTITCFIICLARSKNIPRDGLTHQRGAVLRNSNSFKALWIFTRQGWVWHGKAENGFLRSLGWVAFASAFVVVATLASTFTAYAVDKASLNRLVISDNCGYWELVVGSSGNTTTIEATTALVNATQRASSYARTCYQEGPDATQCNQYMRPNLPWTSTSNASCPFEQRMCNSFEDSVQTSVLNMTSSLLDSLIDLGINSPPSERLLFQMSKTCSTPTDPADWTKDTNGTNPVWYMNYGPIPNKNNYTYKWIDFGRGPDLGYSVSVRIAWAGAGGSWNPIPALRRTDADVAIAFISSNSINYNGSNLDPVFETKVLRIGSDEWNIPARVVGAIACVEQYRTCNPASGTCSPWMGSYQLRRSSMRSRYPNGIPPLWPNHGLSSQQMAINERFAMAAPRLSTYYNLFTRGASALRLQDTLLGSWQTLTLPNDQWAVETKGWFEASLARLQGEIRDFAVGPLYVPDNSLTRDPGDALTQALCKNQLTKDIDNTMNFSVLGIGLIFGLGGLCIIIGLSIEKMTDVYLKYQPKLAYKTQTWKEDAYLQGQRRGFVEKGLFWSSDEIPTTQGHRTVLHFSSTTGSLDKSEGSTYELIEGHIRDTDIPLTEHDSAPH